MGFRVTIGVGVGVITGVGPGRRHVTSVRLTHRYDVAGGIHNHKIIARSPCCPWTYCLFLSQNAKSPLHAFPNVLIAQGEVKLKLI